MSNQADEQERAVDICVVPLADYKECRQDRWDLLRVFSERQKKVILRFVNWIWFDCREKLLELAITVGTVIIDRLWYFLWYKFAPQLFLVGIKSQKCVGKSVSFRTYDLRAVRRKVDKLTAELGKAKVSSLSNDKLIVWSFSEFLYLWVFVSL